MYKQQIEISTGIVIRTIAIIAGLWFLYMVRDVLALFFLSVILTATLDPAIDWMAKRKISRPVGVVIVYVTMVSAVGLLVSLLIPPLVNQFQSFTRSLPAYSETFARTFNGIEQYARSYGIQFDSHEFLSNTFGNI